MPEEPKTTDSLNLANEINTSRYINPRSDFSFKHIFCKEPHKDLLIDFLNGLFKGRKVIIDLVYNNPDHKGILPTYRKTVFDLYCTGDKGEKFIVEMQQTKREFFKDRVVFYTSNMIQEQGISVNPDWNYKLPEIYFVAIMNFLFDDSHPDHCVHDVRLVEINTHEQFYHKLGYIFVELPKFKKSLDQLETEQDEWLFLLNNLNKLDEIPVSLSKKKEYIKLFNIAEVGNLNPDEMNAYQESLKVQRDNYSGLEYAKKEGIKEGLQKGLEEGVKKGIKEGVQKGLQKGIKEGVQKGLEEGAYKKAIEMALEMKKNKEPISKIVKYTSLSAEEISAL